MDQNIWVKVDGYKKTHVKRRLQIDEFKLKGPNKLIHKEGGFKPMGLGPNSKVPI